MLISKGKQISEKTQPQELPQFPKWLDELLDEWQDSTFLGKIGHIMIFLGAVLMICITAYWTFILLFDIILPKGVIFMQNILAIISDGNNTIFIATITFLLTAISLIVANMERLFRTLQFRVNFKISQIDIYDLWDAWLEIAGIILLSIILPLFIIADFANLWIDLSNLHKILSIISVFVVIFTLVMASLLICKVADCIINSKTEGIKNLKKTAVFLGALFIAGNLTYLYMIQLYEILTIQNIKYISELVILLSCFGFMLVVVYKITKRIFGYYSEELVVEIKDQQYLAVIKAMPAGWLLRPCKSVTIEVENKPQNIIVIYKYADAIIDNITGFDHKFLYVKNPKIKFINMKGEK